MLGSGNPGRAPLYVQVKQRLQADIESGHLLPGDRLPSEEELCRQFGVSRITVREALEALAAQGVLMRRQGLGTFVRERKLEKSLTRFIGFADEMRERDIQPSTRVLAIEVQTASRRVQEALQLEPHAVAIRFQRLRLANAEPLVLKTSYLPHSTCAGVLAEDLSVKPLYHVLEHMGHKLVRADETLEAANATDEIAQQLNMAVGGPLLITQEIVYNEANERVEYVESVYRGDLFRFTVKSNRV